MRFYLSASFSRRREMQAIAEVLAETGCHQVTSSWIYEEDAEDDGITDKESAERKREVCWRDMKDMDDCTCLVAFTEEPGSPFSRGGRHVEFGYAMAAGKILIVVGPKENIFHHFGSVIHIDNASVFLGWATA